MLTGCYWGLNGWRRFWGRGGAFGRYRGRAGRTRLLGRPEWKKAFGGNVNRCKKLFKTPFPETEPIKEMDWIGVAEWSTDVLL